MSYELKIIGRSKKGFTMVELIVGIALFSLLFGMGAVVLGNFTTVQSLRIGGERLVQSLREAHTNSVAQRQDSAWGVYFDTISEPDRYIVFKGNHYASRDTSFDQVNQFQKNIDIHMLNIGGGNEVVFAKRSGLTNNSGSIRLSAGEEYYDVSVNGMGMVDFTY